MFLLHRRRASKQTAAVIAEAASLVLMACGGMKARDDAVMMWAATVGKNAFLANWAIAWKSMATPDRSIDARFSLLGLISNWNGNHFSLAAVLTVTPTFLCCMLAKDALCHTASLKEE